MAVVFWVFILICLMLLWVAVTRINDRTSEASPSSVAQSDQDSHTPAAIGTSRSSPLLGNVAPFAIMLGVWAVAIFWMVPWSLRRVYRKDPVLQGVYTIDVTTNQLSIDNTAGISSQVQWRVYESWHEKNGVIVIRYKSGWFFIISLLRASDPQRAELRKILSEALPKK
ncbi:MAG TPA: hypothetical protein VGJ21_25795 [Terracidiphilus sp.]|jgi:hypothetical protein